MSKKLFSIGHQIHFVHLANAYRQNILSIILSFICVPFSLGSICKAREKKNIGKRETKTKNEKKSNNNNKNIVLLVLFYIKKIIFCWKTYLEKLSWIVTFLLEFFHVAGYGHAVIKYQRPCRYALVLQTPYFDPKYLAIN